jgi:hypothetical protein
LRPVYAAAARSYSIAARRRAARRFGWQSFSEWQTQQRALPQPYGRSFRIVPIPRAQRQSMPDASPGGAA